jgi:hypothetical protein
VLNNKADFIARMKPFSGTEYAFSSVFGDTESADLLVSIEGVLTSSGWLRQKSPGQFPALAIWSQTDGVSVGISSGINIVLESTQSQPAALALQKALWTSMGPDRRTAAEVTLSVQPMDKTPNVIHISVGKKP